MGVTTREVYTVYNRASSTVGFCDRPVKSGGYDGDFRPRREDTDGEIWEASRWGGRPRKVGVAQGHRPISYAPHLHPNKAWGTLVDDLCNLAYLHVTHGDTGNTPVPFGRGRHNVYPPRVAIEVRCRLLSNPQRNHVVQGFLALAVLVAARRLEPLLGILPERLEFTPKGSHAVVLAGDAHDVIVLEERTSRVDKLGAGGDKGSDDLEHREPGPAPDCGSRTHPKRGEICWCHLRAFKPSTGLKMNGSRNDGGRNRADEWHGGILRAPSGENPRTFATPEFRSRVLH